MLRRTTMPTVQDLPTGGHMAPTIVQMYQLSSGTRLAVSGSLELLMTGSLTHSTSTSMTTSSGMRSSCTRTCPNSTTTTRPVL